LRVDDEVAPEDRLALALLDGVDVDRDRPAGVAVEVDIAADAVVVQLGVHGLPRGASSLPSLVTTTASGANATWKVWVEQSPVRVSPFGVCSTALVVGVSPPVQAASARTQSTGRRARTGG
jgi:hypothetical protein